jgi:MFS family permease
MFRNKNLVVISLIAVVNALGYGIIIPILYSYSRSFGLTDFQNGLLFSTFSIFQFISTPIIGRLSDKYGRRPLLIISLIGTVISFVLMAIAKNPFWLFASRIIDGATAGNISVASAVISDTTKPKERARGFGMIGAAFGFGFVFGPAISGLTYGVHHTLPFLIAAVIAFASLVLTVVFLPETNKFSEEVLDKKFLDLKLLVKSLFDKKVGVTLFVSLLYSFAFAVLIFAFQPYGIKVLNMDIAVLSGVFTAIGIVGVVSQAFIIPFVSKRLGDKNALTVSLLGSGLMFLAMALAKVELIYIILTVGMAFFNSFVAPLIQTLLSKEMDEASQGSILGLNAAYVGLGSIFGPIAGGAVATFNLTMPFVLIVGVVAICYLLSLRIKVTAHPEHAF